MNGRGLPLPVRALRGEGDGISVREGRWWFVRLSWVLVVALVQFKIKNIKLKIENGGQGFNHGWT